MGPTDSDCEVFWGFEILTWCGLHFVAFKDLLDLDLLGSKPSTDRGFNILYLTWSMRNF